MSDLEALLLTINDNWGDHTPKGALADKLDELGKPVEAALWRVLGNPWDNKVRLHYADAIEDIRPEKAEFIRTMIEMDNHRTGKHLASYKNDKVQDELHESCHDLLLVHWNEWTYSLMPCSAGGRVSFTASAIKLVERYSPAGAEVLWGFHRGFVEQVTMPWPLWTENGDIIRGMTPLEEVILTNFDLGRRNIHVHFVARDSNNRRLVYEVAGKQVFIDELELNPRLLREEQYDHPTIMSRSFGIRWPGIKFRSLSPEQERARRISRAGMRPRRERSRITIPTPQQFQQLIDSVVGSQQIAVGELAPDQVVRIFEGVNSAQRRFDWASQEIEQGSEDQIRGVIEHELTTPLDERENHVHGFMRERDVWQNQFTTLNVQQIREQMGLPPPEEPDEIQ